MSYILDALRRAERERHLGQTPTVQSLAQAGSPHSPVPQRRWLRPALAAVMLVLLAGSAWMLLSKPANDAAATEPQPATALPAVVHAPAPMPVQSALPAAVESAAAADVIGEDIAVESLDDVAPQFVAGSNMPAAAVPQQDQPGQAPPMPNSSAAPPAEPTTPSVSDDHLPRTLREMPPTYRAGFPVVGLDVHVYDADPARRWVMVGGRRYNENETLASGPRILSIVAEGVIVEHAGERVLLPLNR